MSKYTIYFERYIGRSLYKWERRIVAPLEYIRQHGQQRRVIIVDRPGYDSRELLCTYLRFIHDRIRPGLTAIAIDRTTAQARRITAYTPVRDRQWLSIASGLRPNHLRGLTFDYALLLNADRYFPISATIPALTARRNFTAILKTVAPVVSTAPGGFIIIHIRGRDPGIPPVYQANPTTPTPHAPPPHSAPRLYIIDPDLTADQIAEHIFNPDPDLPPTSLTRTPLR